MTDTTVRRDLADPKAGSNDPSEDTDHAYDTPKSGSFDPDDDARPEPTPVASLSDARTDRHEVEMRDLAETMPPESKFALMEMERSVLPEIASEQIIGWYRRARQVQHEFERIAPERLRAIAAERPDSCCRLWAWSWTLSLWPLPLSAGCDRLPDAVRTGCHDGH